MRSSAIMIAFTLCACHARPLENAASGAPPAIQVPVGPVPGPGKAVERQNPYGTEVAAVAQGRRWFMRYNCAGCHGDHGGGGMGPSLRDQAWLYGSTDDHVFDSIAEGRGKGMPAWGTKLPSEQIWELVSYVKTLRTSKEAEPPQ